jgi:hypothetical protein
MRRWSLVFVAALGLLALLSCSNPRTESENASSEANKLKEWRKGVWLLGDGSYAIFTDDHYFVVQVSGDSASPNIYCGASQVVYHRKGMARKQVIRVRQLPGGELFSFKQNVLGHDAEIPLVIDTTLFVPNTCNIKDGIIYDSITEETDEYILLATCSGDYEKIYSNGTSAYLPAQGGEFYSIRIEKF